MLGSRVGTTMSYSAIAFDRAAHATALRKIWGANFSAVGIERVLEARERWLYDECPAGPPETAIGRIDETGEVIGCASILPWPRSFGGRPVRSGVMIDFGVDPAHRTSGPAVTMQRRLAEVAQPRGFQLLFGYPNDRSAGVFLRVGFKRIAPAEVWVFPLKMGTYLERLLAKVPKLDQLPISLATLARIGAPAATLAFRAVVQARALLTATKYTTEELDRADATFDVLHDEARANIDLLGDHSAAYLNWRYGDFKTARYRFFALRERATGALAAYAVWAREGEDIVIADILARRPDDPALDALLLRLAVARAGDDARRMVLSYVGAPSFTARLPRLFFAKAPPVKRALLAYLPPDAPAELKERVLRPESWFIFDGELDI